MQQSNNSEPERKVRTAHKKISAYKECRSCKNKITNFFAEKPNLKLVEKEEVGLVKMIAQENMSISHSEKIIEFLKEYIPDSNIVKEMRCQRTKATRILGEQIYPTLLENLQK